MKSAVLVIDVQRGLFDPSPRPYEADRVVDRINRITSKARADGIPVIFIQHEQTSGELVRGGRGWQLERGLEVQDGDVFIGKATPDAFLKTELEPRLAELGVRRLILCGYASEFCVDTTARRAAALGYAVQLAADAHTTHDKAHAPAEMIRAHHNATLSDIVSFGVPITAVPAVDICFDE